MAMTYWHKVYVANVSAPPQAVFGLIADLPKYPDWLPGSEEYRGTTDVEPYPVQLGSRYRDGKPGEEGKDWWGTVIGYQPPGSLDFQHSIAVAPARGVVDVHIHYSFAEKDGGTLVQRWLLLEIRLPLVLLPVKGVIVRRFDAENVRTMDAVARHFGGV